jgi:hypothetical protein
MSKRTLKMKAKQAQPVQGHRLPDNEQHYNVGGEREVLDRYDDLRKQVESNINEQRQSFLKDKERRQKKLQSSFKDLKDRLNMLSKATLPLLLKERDQQAQRVGMLKKRQQDFDESSARVERSKADQRNINEFWKQQASELQREVSRHCFGVSVYLQ